MENHDNGEDDDDDGEGDENDGDDDEDDGDDDDTLVGARGGVAGQQGGHWL